VPKAMHEVATKKQNYASYVVR